MIATSLIKKLRVLSFKKMRLRLWHKIEFFDNWAYFKITVFTETMKKLIRQHALLLKFHKCYQNLRVGDQGLRVESYITRPGVGCWINLIAVFLKFSQNSKENTCARVSFLIMFTLPQVFSCEFYETFNNNLFTEHRATASNYTFTERKTSTLRTKTWRINNTAQIIVLIQKKTDIYLIFSNREKIIQTEGFCCLKKKTVWFLEDSRFSLQGLALGPHPKVLSFYLLIRTKMCCKKRGIPICLHLFFYKQGSGLSPQSCLVAYWLHSSLSK